MTLDQHSKRRASTGAWFFIHIYGKKTSLYYLTSNNSSTTNVGYYQHKFSTKNVYNKPAICTWSLIVYRTTNNYGNTEELHVYFTLLSVMRFCLTSYRHYYINNNKNFNSIKLQSQTERQHTRNKIYHINTIMRSYEQNLVKPQAKGSNYYH